MTFPLCDTKGSNFSTDVNYSRLEGLNYWQAKGDCTAKWDRSQLRRIGGQNTELVAYWIRNALNFSTKHNNRGRGSADPRGIPGQVNPAAVAGQPTMPINQAVILSKLIFIFLLVLFLSVELYSQNTGRRSAAPGDPTSGVLTAMSSLLLLLPTFLPSFP